MNDVVTTLRWFDDVEDECFNHDEKDLERGKWEEKKKKFAAICGIWKKPKVNDMKNEVVRMTWALTTRPRWFDYVEDEWPNIKRKKILP